MPEQDNTIGFDVPEPDTDCSDPNCPFHGELSPRGTVLEGRVDTDDMQKTVVVESEYEVKAPKYDRYMRRRSRVPAHSSPCIDASEGDTVRIAECRPLSKTKSFVVIEVLEGEE
ncbi:MAG: 30S ribosomal protein S17 [Halobacteria archaeon]|nr:30S ribosomal protein S17 [Halobacteria archaeon]